MKSVRKALVGEGCEDVHDIFHAEQARGILQIHAGCEPPCRRKVAAREFLRWTGTDPDVA
ncbi:hypothetical protein [Nocardia sp. CS682]|uniref:hypothetical protein n=1 Tax=Nocardia sp. CS682 TaxID=1047172 RepID=UPI00107542B3|nr:hypothetical protein [Nocardia sp. CS682]QBS44919.1 hypothetical protein DMB37_37400 [Nocardia sp. CS682]